MDNFIQRIENEIYMQIRNGRKEVYLKVEDLKKLGFDIDPKETDRVYKSADSVLRALKKYEKDIEDER